MRSLIIVLLMGVAAGANAQLTISPEKPKAGDKITFTFIPAGDLAMTSKKVDGYVFSSSGATGARKSDDLLMTKAGKRYTGTITTDTAQTFLQLAFSADNKFDNNFGEGYTILLHSGDKVKKGGYYAQSLFHQYYGSESGVDKNAEKSLADLGAELSLYPEQKKQIAGMYYRTLGGVRKEEVLPAVEKDIEAALKAGLKTEADYSYLQQLYTAAAFPQQAKLIGELLKEKFPNGKWTVGESINSFSVETDLVKKEQALDALTKTIASHPEWKEFQAYTPRLKSMMLSAYASKKQWDSYNKLAATIADKSIVASANNNTAWELQEKNEDIKVAQALSKMAADYTYSEWKNPSTPKPDYYVASKWEAGRRSSYAMYADTYAMVLYKLGEYKKGFELAKESALTINEGKSADNNNTYALLGEKVLPAKELKPQLEKFIKTGKATSEIKDILKKEYIAEKKSEAGFDTYITGLEQENHLAMLAELKKTMLSSPAPAFAMTDLEGKPVTSTDLLGKVVVMDFWATWCGPCKASFPGMQKMVTKFKDNPNVKFVFVDTWEKGENKVKDAADFISANKYTFHVAMDLDDKVIGAYQVSGIPTKFVLDKEGKIRFKAVGFDGSDDKLISELSAMIEMASAEKGM